MTNPAETFEAKTYSKADVRLLPFLFLCYILAYLDRVNVGFAKLQMLKDLSVSDAAFATGAGILFIGYFFFEVPLPLRGYLLAGTFSSVVSHLASSMLLSR